MTGIVYTYISCFFLSLSHIYRVFKLFSKLKAESKLSGQRVTVKRKPGPSISCVVLVRLAKRSGQNRFGKFIKTGAFSLRCRQALANQVEPKPLG